MPINRMDVHGTQEMPPRKDQEHLLNLHFTYTYACFPIVRHKEVMEQFRSWYALVSQFSQGSCLAKHSWNEKSEFNSSTEFRLVLLSIFSLSARHSTRTPIALRETQGISLWEAGNDYFKQAKDILSKFLLIQLYL